MSPHQLVEAFYFEVWNRADEDRAREILADSFRFRGSLGVERVGPDGFIAYMRDVHRALGDYRCIIDELVTDGDRAAARMRFTGKHRAEFLGVAATGRQITWAGAAFFRIEGGRISDLWVLGDVVALRRQMAE
ncbi:MAG: ester cyclase [Acidobacteria bacterium]|nr:ester cyclase [Acidobacteriota bacterium]MYF14805.1 ester cyclase [Acidobacteriota bacterium]